MFKPCAVVPVYNHEGALPQTVAAILSFDLPIILVDDGSNEACKKVMASLKEQHTNVSLATRSQNGGKGAAVKTGLKAALEQGYTHGLQIDADGQHNHNDIPLFIETAKQSPTTLISGIPQYDDSIPKGRLYGRYLTHVWVWINTLSLDISDSMCGFRVYPLKESCALIDNNAVGNRMDYDTEFIVLWHWANRPIKEIKTSVTYPLDGVSHFLAWQDNKLISIMHAKLFFGMLMRLPKLIAQKRLSNTTSQI